MRLTVPIIILLTLLNLSLVLKVVVSDGTQLDGDKNTGCVELNNLELLKARDEIMILRIILDGYREGNSPTAHLQQALEEIEELKNVLAGYKEANTHRLRLSAYTARPEETNDDVEHTAIMQTPRPGWTVAVSHDLRGWLGKRVYIEGFGVRMVSDLMNARYTRSIDILVPDVEMAMSIGVKRNVLVTLIEPLIQDNPLESNIIELMEDDLPLSPWEH
ncbi:3D (Asp-Asp-Asp) domain-containing protein [Desulfonatronum thiosulfatophilum]|uniref:3D (Asp-Asp-Asp) domain-containing protein n=1 Tax=Desulfonatronum thiosulfatophilum TaxID=617002 RepID=A0A1G6ERC2_9BACT|nr:3D domain-containing protein [Desulfonatronum thiosulfatophilum]SDB60099.1 3D (Asp-Asp-Asp) domain-containing protein [Desulfonatronum thiosulfatophilum]